MTDEKVQPASSEPSNDAKPLQIRPRLPSNVRIQKRPLYHPPIASPHAGPSQQKVIYISTDTPFMSAVKRVRKILAAIEKRYMGHPLAGPRSQQARRPGSAKNDSRRRKERDSNAAGLDYGASGASGRKGDAGQSSSITEGRAPLEDRPRGKENKKEEVYLKATNRAIEKALNLAIFFQQAKEGYHVTIKTGTISVVDDIVEVERPKKRKRKRDGKRAARETEEAEAHEDASMKDTGERGEDAGVNKGDDDNAMSGEKEVNDVEMTETEEVENKSEGIDPNEREQGPGKAERERIETVPEDPTVETNGEERDESQEGNATDDDKETTEEGEREDGVEDQAQDEDEDEVGQDEEQNQRPDLPETQIRRMSFVQVGIRLR